MTNVNSLFISLPVLCINTIKNRMIVYCSHSFLERSDNQTIMIIIPVMNGVICKHLIVFVLGSVYSDWCTVTGVQ